MRMMVVGLVLGLVLGTMISALAQTRSYFWNETKFLNAPESQQRYYLMGVYDTFELLSDNDTTAADTVRCMNQAGENAEGLRLWAVRRVQQNHPSGVVNDAVVDVLFVANLGLPCTP